MPRPRQPHDESITAANLAAAIALATAGLAIFPASVWQNSEEKWQKRPVGAEWQTRATANTEQVRAWWSNGAPIVPGIELGRANLIVIDADRHGGPDGVAALTALAADQVEWPVHPIVLTAGGGEHHIFRQPTDRPPLGNGAGDLPPGLDVRGRGGWIVGPGTMRPDGKTWAPAPGSPLLDQAFRANTIPELPQWLADLIRPNRPQNEENQGTNNRSPTPWSPAEEARVRSALESISSEGRTEWINVGMALHETGWDNAFDIWDEWSKTAPAAYDADDQRKTWESFSRPFNGTRITLATLFDLAIKQGWQDQQKPSSAPPPPLPFIDISNWDNELPPPRQWAVLDRFPLRQTSLFSGEGSAGKSALQLHLSVAHVLGRDWLGTMPELGPAIYADAEDDRDEIHRRLVAILDHYRATFEDVHKGGLHLISLAGHNAVLAIAGRAGKIEPTPLYKQLLEAAGDIRPKMIGIASAANVYAGSELERSQVQQFISLLTKLAIVANGAVVLISHPSLTGINTDTGLSGNTAWHNSVRARCYLKGVKPEAGGEPDNDLRELTFKKNNYGPISASVVLRYQNGLFLPVPGVASLDRAAHEATADDVFLALLRRFTAANRAVSDKPSASYAPALFAREDEARRAGLTSKALEAAMRRLFKAGKIWNEPCGRPSRPQYRIALKN
jgi:RecA-family ATPase